MASLVWRGSRAYVVARTTEEGKHKARWLPLGRFDTHREGEAAYARWILEHGHTNQRGRGRLGQIIPAYLEYESHYKAAAPLNKLSQAARLLDRELGHLELDRITPQELEGFLHRHPAWKPNTIRLYFTLLRQIMRHANQRNYLVSDPWSAVKIPRPALYRLPPRYATEEQLDAVMSRLSGPHLWMAFVLRYTGMRPGEAWILKPESVTSTQVSVYARKTNSVRNLPIAPGLDRIIYPWPLKIPVTPGAFAKALKRACRVAGLPSSTVTPYTFRHSFATSVLNRCKDIRTVQQLLGHTSIVLTTRYAHATSESLQEAVRSLVI